MRLVSRDKTIYNAFMEHSPLRLGFLASHNGTDMRAVVEEIRDINLNATAEVVISNNSTSPALAYAREKEIDAIHISSKTHANPDEAIVHALLSRGVELVIFSGYMKVLQEDSPILLAYPGKIWNPHPADTKKYPGLWGDSIHEKVLFSGDEYTFPTIHIVTGTVDGGPILAQGKIKVEPDDTVATLKPRVQKEEIRLFLDLLKSRSTQISFHKK